MDYMKVNNDDEDIQRNQVISVIKMGNFSHESKNPFICLRKKKKDIKCLYENNQAPDKKIKFKNFFSTKFFKIDNLLGDSTSCEMERITPAKALSNQDQFQFKMMFENQNDKYIEKKDELKENSINNDKIKKFSDFSSSQKEEIISQLDIISNLPTLDNKIFNSFKINLPAQKRTDLKKTLLIDLDETLIHSFEMTKNYSQKNLKLHQIQANIFGKFQQINFVIRPFLFDFLTELSKKFELIIYTSSVSNYANAILSIIDPKKSFFSKVLSREECFLVKNYIIKDIRIIGNRDPKQVIIIDNQLLSFYSCLTNGILIESFYGDPEDATLQSLLPFLLRLENVKDVRIELEKEFDLKKINNDFITNKRLLAKTSKSTNKLI